jgi:hypothetical protein
MGGHSMMYKISFSNLVEVRMGSPFSIASVHLSGGFVPDLPERTFQDIALLNPTGSICFLVQWQTDDGNAGFVVWRLSNETKSVDFSKRIVGCCEKLEFENGTVVASVFVYPERKKQAVGFPIDSQG